MLKRPLRESVNTFVLKSTWKVLEFLEAVFAHSILAVKPDVLLLYILARESGVSWLYCWQYICLSFQRLVTVIFVIKFVFLCQKFCPWKPQWISLTVSGKFLSIFFINSCNFVLVGFECTAIEIHICIASQRTCIFCSSQVLVANWFWFDVFHCCLCSCGLGNCYIFTLIAFYTTLSRSGLWVLDGYNFVYGFRVIL